GLGSPSQGDSVIWAGSDRGGEGPGPLGLEAVTKPPFTAQNITNSEVVSRPVKQAKCQQPVERPNSAQVQNLQAIKSKRWQHSLSAISCIFWSSMSQIGQNVSTLGVEANRNENEATRPRWTVEPTLFDSGRKHFVRRKNILLWRYAFYAYPNCKF